MTPSSSRPARQPSTIRVRKTAPSTRGGADMQTLDLDWLKAGIRDIPDFPKPGILFRDITPLLKDAQRFRAVIEVLADRYRDQRITAIAAIEARGFIFGAALALALGVGLDRKSVV